MGNILSGRPVSSNRQKDFNSVLPEPISDPQGIKKRKLPSNEEVTPAPHEKLASAESTPATIKSENVDRSVSYKHIDSDFDNTEGQLRRGGMADCEFECSQITKFLFVAGHRVAENLELLKEKKITRIVNCASAISPNYHEGYSDIKYLTMNLVDGRQEDISWFICAVINFVYEGTSRGENTLIHCERGISRSCSFVIAYRMWSTGEMWKTAFEYVQQRRKICSPNTAFMCNLIEIGEILNGSSSEATLLFRCAYHASHDTGTPVLKLCRNLHSRRILVPATSLLNPQGVYVLRCIKAGKHYLYSWQGNLANPSTADIAESLALKMCRVFSNATQVIKMKAGEESEDFLSFLLKDGPFRKYEDACADYGDFYDKVFGTGSPYYSVPQEGDKQVSEILMGFAEKASSSSRNNNNNNKNNSVAIEIGKANKNKAALSISLPPLNTDSTTNKDSNNRSISRERSSARRGGNGGGTSESMISARRMDSDPPSIALPVSLSRANSFRSEDGQPSVSRQQIVSRINNIISTVANESHANRPRDRVEMSAPNSSRSVAAMEALPPSRPHQPPPSSSSVSLKTHTNLTKLTESNSGNNHNHNHINNNSNTTVTIPSEETASTPFFSRSSSKNKVAPLSEVLVAELTRVNSSERRLFGSSPRVVPFTPTTEIQSSATPSKVKSPVERLDISPNETKASSLIQLALPPIGKRSESINNSSTKAVPLSLNARLGVTSLDTNNHNSHTISNLPSSQSVENSRSVNGALSSDRDRSASNSGGSRASSNPPAPSRPKTLHKPLLYRAKKVNATSNTLFEWESMGVYDDEDLDEGDIYLLLCPNMQHHLWVGNDFDFSSAKIMVDDDGKPIMSRLLKWAAKVNIGEVIDKSYVSSGLLTNEVAIHMSGEESEEFWTSFNEGF